MSREVIINDANYRQFLDPIVDGETRARGLRPRNYARCPVGYLDAAKPFDLPLIPESEWQSRLDAQKAAHAQLSDIRNQGMNGAPIPSRDQNGKGYSHTEDTEVLTEKGWVRWPDWNKTDLLATVNLSTQIMEFQAPTEWHAYEYDDEMFYSTNRRLDFGVTRNHRMIVRAWDERRRTLSDVYSEQRADQLGWYVGMMPAPRGFIGTEFDLLSIVDDRQYSGDDFLALLAVITSDGYAGASDNTRNLVSFCCFRDDRYPMVAELAQRLGFEEQSSRRGVWSRQWAPALAAWIRANCYTDGSTCTAPNKRIPDLVKCASERQIKHFLRYFGDQNHGVGVQPVFYSSSRRQIDDLQELHLRIGKRSTISNRGPRTAVMKTGHEIHGKESFVLTVAETDRLCIDRKKHIETDHYRGLVYCATVPNGTLITRRNGSVLISGNCWAHSSTSACLIVRAVNNLPYADLSAYAVACIIKGYRDQGGWGAESLEWIAENGIPTSKTWPQQSMSRSNDTPAMRAEAKQNIVSEWMDLDPQNVKAQLVTCLLSGIPVVVDMNWWSHSICAVDLVSISPFSIRIWNSWGDSWSDNGMGILEGRKAIPDGAIAPRVVGGSIV